MSDRDKPTPWGWAFGCLLGSLMVAILALLTPPAAPTREEPAPAMADGPVIRHSTWCPPPGIRERFVTDGGAEVEEVPMAKGGPRP